METEINIVQGVGLMGEVKEKEGSGDVCNNVVDEDGKGRRFAFSFPTEVQMRLIWLVLV